MASRSDDHVDGELVARLRRGDESALNTLYERHKAAVFWTAMHVVRSRPDAEELAVDVFLTLWKRRRSVTLHGESALPWLLVTAKNLARNRQRAMRRRYADRLEEQQEHAAGDMSPDEAAMLREAMAHLDRILFALPRLDRDIFNLCLIEDLSYKQAAHRLGTTHATVRNRLSRVRRRLRDELSAQYEGNG